MSALATPSASAATPAPAASEFDIADDEYVSGAQFKRMMQSVTQPNAGVAELAASTALGLVRQEFASDFAKYGRAIDALVAQVPANLRNLDNLRRVVRMVRSDHVDEIAHERAQQLVSAMEPALRSTGGGAPPVPLSREHSLEGEKVPAEWKRRAVAAGITESVVADFCRANFMTPADFYKQFDTPMNKIVEDVPARRNA